MEEVHGPMLIIQPGSYQLIFVNVHVNKSGELCNGNNCIVVGQYQSQWRNNVLYPFLLSSQDGGHTWSAPVTVIDNLPPDYVKVGVFYGAQCNTNICTAVGEYTSSSFNGQSVPLLANSLDGGKSWIYPSLASINYPTSFLNGKLSATSCNVSDCIAEGSYTDVILKKTYPLLLSSHDSGKTWAYPPSIFSGLPGNYFNNGKFTNGGSSYTWKKK